MALHWLFARKPITQILRETQTHKPQLRRSLGKWHLTALGIGAIIGAGIFAAIGSAIAGDAVRPGAGPAIVISFLFTAVTCGFAALCYAEFAAMVPITGSAYTYAYASLGELVAWIIGWDLILEYAVGNIAVAISWSGYFREFLGNFGWHIPPWLGIDYRSAHEAAGSLAQGITNPSIVYAASALREAPHAFGIPLIINLPAFGIVASLTAILVHGIETSATTNSIMVLVKVGIVLFFVAVGAIFIDPHNYISHGGFAPNGFEGISAAAAIIFFSYIGFDAVSTAAEEAYNPQRDMPFAIVMSLTICTALYILAAVVMTGMAPWDRLGTSEPMLTAFTLSVGNPALLAVAKFVVSLGAVIAMTTVLLVFQLGQSRIFFAMARDGLLPLWATKVHPRFHTPHVTTIVTGVCVASCAAFADIAEVIDLTNIGTLFAFALVAAGVLVLRYIDPERQRPYRTPLVPFVPLAAILSCGYLMLQLPALTWERFVIWLGAGLVLYFLYGYRRSSLRNAAAVDKC